ncbi:hypothetical protein DL93DRAFT_40934 [Clavulina sp. PMI_390]|nr:hypothetical protein DL93DRAFT_40934 [Clavulina sp. PMI_390]
MYTILMQASGMTDAEAALVQCPMLVVQGDINPFFNAKSAQDFVRHYPNAPSRIYMIAGAAPAISRIPEYAPILNRQVIAHIEASLLSSPTSPTSTVSKLRPDETTMDERRSKGMREAMDSCMSVAPEWLKKELKARDPQSAMSFSRRSPEQLREMHERWYDTWLEVEKEVRHTRA